MDAALDGLGPQFARWLAPYVAEELRRGGLDPVRRTDFDDAICAEFTRELGVNSLHRANDFFAKLEAAGAADSLEMAQHLSVGTPRNLSSAVTTPIKRISKRLGLPLPWTEGESAEGRTVWRDRDGIAARMHKAIAEEQHRRFGS
jgi:hypothetical protein